jgi:hypothetical protein
LTHAIVACVITRRVSRGVSVEYVLYCTTVEIQRDNNEGKWTKRVPYVLTNLGRKPRAFSGSSTVGAFQGFWVAVS